MLTCIFDEGGQKLSRKHRPFVEGHGYDVLSCQCALSQCRSFPGLSLPLRHVRSTVSTEYGGNKVNMYSIHGREVGIRAFAKFLVDPPPPMAIRMNNANHQRRTVHQHRQLIWKPPWLLDRTAHASRDQDTGRATRDANPELGT
jgi:hypothetical protein